MFKIETSTTIVLFYENNRCDVITLVSFEENKPYDIIKLYDTRLVPHGGSILNEVTRKSVFSS
jgi:hypothetical protein